MFNAYLIGLGNIGLGYGIYSQSWNSHYDSLVKANWIKDIYVYDPLLKQSKDIPKGSKLLKKENLSKDPKSILIDAASPEGRKERIEEYSSLLQPEIIFVEKPFDHSTITDYDIYPWNVTKVNYPRKKFLSTRLVEDFCAFGWDKIEFNFNNGVSNAVTHFLDLIYRFDKNIAKNLNFKYLNNSVSLGNILINKVHDDAGNIFEFTVYRNKEILRYLDFGRSIHINGQVHLFDELDHRFKNIYSSIIDLKSMPRLKEDRNVYDAIKQIEYLYENEI